MKRLIMRKSALGVAAPQIGVSKRFFVMFLAKKFWVCINPKIISKYGGEFKLVEGCLSLPGYSKEMSRFDYIDVEFFDDSWKKITMSLCGLHARVFQHELDHLNGVLISDI